VSGSYLRGLVDCLLLVANGTLHAGMITAK